MKPRTFFTAGTIVIMFLVLLTGTALASGDPSHSAAAAMPQDGSPWWYWPIILLFVTFAMGIVAVLGGVGGGVLFVPHYQRFFPISS